ncbi:hypothetical protein PMAYCL1PPCAC_25567, partial [Pristionchus mayeri]
CSIDSSTIDPAKFCSPINHGNVTLVIDGKRLGISKEFLAVYSPVFAAMFFGDFTEKGKEEVEIKDVVYEEFVDLVELIFPLQAQISDSTLPHILALGDRFQMQQVITQCENHLISSTTFTKVEKLHLSDQYRLEKLKVATIIFKSNI